MLIEKLLLPERFHSVILDVILVVDEVEDDEVEDDEAEDDEAEDETK